ncbi:hypothetical protein SETIT_1G234900v2 [Setaria italica]|uniref:Uncharacterized protein n=1 Tax=Setaria italica TaxID=4555 RepID=K3YXR7_SETIT|nr:uncharacterized protein LOC101762622 [Setaria italica]RCV07327.1 hypothetical protein SETIT_1G234900v2 [Setaria italica]
MDRLQRRNPSSRPHSTSMKPPRHPRGPTIQHPPASRPLSEPSSPDGRQRKRVRFSNEGEGGSHHIGGRQVAYIREVAKNKPRVCDAKTAEYKFFKKLCEQSGHSTRLYKHPHQILEPKISKQKRESHNVTTLRKFSVHGNTVVYDDPPATPAKNEEIPSEQVNVQSSHSECDDKDTPQFNPHGCLPSIHVLTPIAQTSFDVTGTSGNIGREPVSGQIFSEKRSKLLMIAAKTVSMGSAELFQRRSEFVGDILQRLGAKNIIRKQEGSMRHSKIDHREAPAIPKGQFDYLLDYRRRDFNPSTKLRRTGKSSSSDASDDAREFMALPWGYNQGLPSFIDWKHDVPCGDSKARECMALPWVCVNDISSSDWKRGNQVSNLLLEDVEPCVHRRTTSANELSLNVQTASNDQHGWNPMLSVKLTESFRDRLSFPYQIEEQHHAVPYAVLNTSWQPDYHSSTKQCVSSSVRMEREDPKEAGSFDNSDARFATTFDQLPAKSAALSFLDSGNEILENNDFRFISNSHVSQSKKMVFSANTGCLNSMFSILEHPYELGAKSLHDSAIGVSCLAGLEEKYSREVELSDDSDRLLQVLDQLPVKFTPSSFSNDEFRIRDDHLLRYITSCPQEDNSSILSLDANDSGLNSLSSYSAQPCKPDWNSLHDSSTELWSSVHRLQSHADWGPMLGFMPNGNAYSDLVEGHHSLMLVQDNLKNDILGTTDLSFFGSCSALDNIREAPMLSSDGITL